MVCMVVKGWAVGGTRAAGALAVGQKLPPNRPTANRPTEKLVDIDSFNSYYSGDGK
jgi:hypothetical protein